MTTTKLVKDVVAGDVLTGFWSPRGATVTQNEALKRFSKKQGGRYTVHHISFADGSSVTLAPFVTVWLKG